VEGELGRRLSTAFEGMQVEARDGMTYIVGTISDQAHLHGLLDKIASLGLELVSVAPANGEERPPGTPPRDAGA
jgi:hypothetical protein